VRNLMEEIRKDMTARQPELTPDAIEYRAEVVCLIICAAELPESTEEMRKGICFETGYAEEEVSAFLTALEAGEAFTKDGFHGQIQEDLAGENSGMVITLLTAIALGKMIYHPKNGTYSLSNNGIRHVENMLKKAPKESA
jgi:hypothetical protein